MILVQSVRGRTKTSGHLTHRCHKKEYLLKFARDRRRWMEWLFEAKKRYGIRVLNYMVTSNHACLLAKLKSKEWVVYSKKPFAGPERVLDYLGRYTHRVAISNHRIKNIEQGRVTFTYRDRSEGEALKEMTLKAEEFIRRFLLHVLPNGFVRIRHFGFLANRCKKQNLKHCRKFFNVPEKQSPTVGKTWQELMLGLTGMDVTQCPCCKQGKMQMIGEIPRIHEPNYLDSS